MMTDLAHGRTLGDGQAPKRVRRDMRRRWVYFRAGSVERGTGTRRGYVWRDGYSRLTAGGKMEFPWMTKREAQSAARAGGGKAVFFDSREAAEGAFPSVAAEVSK